MSEIRIYPDSILRGKAIPLENVDSKAKKMVDDMIMTMHSHKGIGLAAPQIGLLLKVIVVNSEHGVTPLINPEILESEGEIVGEEGCLSVPEVTVNVSRALHILIRGVDLAEREVEFETSGLLARVFQHEVDHLEGKLIIDHITRLKRSLIKSRLKKRAHCR